MNMLARVSVRVKCSSEDNLVSQPYLHVHMCFKEREVYLQLLRETMFKAVLSEMSLSCPAFLSVGLLQRRT